MNRHSPTAALAWEIWRRNQLWIALISAMLIGGSLAVLLSSAETAPRSEMISALYSTLGGLSLLFVFGMFHYTEFDTGTGFAGFPRRLFTLPVSSLRLIAVPLVLGVLAVEVVGAVISAWSGEFHVEMAAGLAAFMIAYQTVLWTCARLGPWRSLVLGALAVWFLYMGFIGFGATTDAVELHRMSLVVSFVGIAGGAFVVSWIYVLNLRSGGGRRTHVRFSVEPIADVLPRRRRPFQSPAAAQFWLEWRRSGRVLPILVAAVLALAIAPLSWVVQANADSTILILLAVLLMPPLLALPVGKGFSKPDIWSAELALPAFLAVRPLSNRDFISIKMKVAAASAAFAWLATLLFLAFWLTFAANPEGLRRAGAILTSLYPGMSPVLAALLLFALMLTTWRCLVSGLWIGVSGSRNLFVISALPYALAPVVLAIVVVVIERRRPVIGWILDNVNTLLPLTALALAVAIIVKIALAIRSAARIGRQYMVIWSAATGLLLALALLLSNRLDLVTPSHATHLRNIFVLIALAYVPLARLGIASSAFDRNRHR